MQHIVIPARYGSSRLPGKPLKLLAGKPMIEHVHQQACLAGDDVWIATDDARIYDVVRAFDAQALMTSPNHISGTDRLAEVCELQAWADEDTVINVQGDEPQMPPALIHTLANLMANSDAGMATLATPIRNAEDIFNPNIVKVVLDAKGQALYFSRAVIPWCRDAFASESEEGRIQQAEKMLADGSLQVYRHLGMYAYLVRTLRLIPTLTPCALEQLESLEQLRPLYHGIAIQVGIIDKAPEHGVDTEADLLRVEKAILQG